MPRELQQVIDDLGVNCPNGGSFYVCKEKPTRFVGCCTTDPCKTDDGSCPHKDLRRTSYDKFSHNQILPQTCVSQKSGVEWYTCGDIKTPFMGCCSADACGADNGCPADSIYAAKLSDNEEDAAVFLPSSSASSSPTNEPGDDDGDGGGLSKGAVGGIAAGVTVGALAIIGVLIFFFLRRRKRSTQLHGSYEPYAGQPVAHGPDRRSPWPQDAKFSPYSPYPSSYSPTPSSLPPVQPYDPSQGGQTPPLDWQAQQGAHVSHMGAMAPSLHTNSTSPAMVQGQFRDSVQTADFRNSGQPPVQELPGGTEFSGGQAPNVSDVSYGGGNGRESEVSGMTGWGHQVQNHPVELAGSEQR